MLMVGHINNLNNENHWQILWNFPLSQRVILFLWKLCSSSLPTCHALQDRHLLVDKECCLCHGGDETLDHLFLQYPFVRAI